MLDLRQLYDVLRWSYSGRDKKPGEGVCIVVVPPGDIGRQYPTEGKAGEDSSPPHVTVGYFGDVDPALENKVVGIAESVCKNTSPFNVSIGSPNWFKNEDKPHDVLYSTIKGKGLHDFRGLLQSAYSMGQMQFDGTHPTYKPHMTIEYVSKGDEAKYKDLRPEGKWQVDNAWLWGFSEPHLLQFD